MLKIDPRFYIYGDPIKESGRSFQFLLFGGVGLEAGPYNDSKLTSEMSELLKDVTGPFYQAYEVKSIISRPTDTELLCRIYPISGTIDRNCEDYSFGALVNKMKERGHRIEDTKKIEKLFTQMIEEKKDTTVFFRPEGYYFMYRLAEEFDPAGTEYFLKTLETLLLNLVGKNYRIQSGIEKNFLKVDMEIIRYSYPYIS